MTARALVLDANILVRAVLGRRVRDLITDFAAEVDFFAPATAFDDAQRHMPTIAQKRGIHPVLTLEGLDSLRLLVEVLPTEAFGPYKTEALRRLKKRDADDWPILASALAIGCPIWTEDKDFFGAGVPTWITALVEIYLKNEHTAKPTDE